MTKQKALVLALVVVAGIGLVIALVANSGGPELITNPDGSEARKVYCESGQIEGEATANPGGNETFKRYYESGQLKSESTINPDDTRTSKRYYESGQLES